VGTARITLLSRPGCHLCDQARAVIERVAAELGVGWTERDITASPDDMREYWDKIPVTFVDGVQVDFWRISEARLRAALTRQRLQGSAYKAALTRQRSLDRPVPVSRVTTGGLCEWMHKGVPWRYDVG
jgi:glutaredoxin